jgi:HAD superfamily hydrolase (TIGR01509 family)
MPGVAEALAQIPGPKCVASSSEIGKIRLELDVAGLRPFFGDALFSGRDVPLPKPAPDIYFHAAREMGVAPEHCAVVEDSMPGIAAALAAGMTVFGYRVAARTGVAPLPDWRDLPGLLG